MKIIKRGELPEEKVYQETCSRCKSELEFKAGELRSSPDPRDQGECYVMCPVCNSHLWVRRK